MLCQNLQRKKLANLLHVFLQPQFGIGKTYISFLLRQYLSDQTNINYTHIQNKNIPLWDQLFDNFFNLKNAIFIIFVSSICFADFKKYLTEAMLLETIEKSGNKLFNHYVFTPGRAGENFKEIHDYIVSNIEKSGMTIIWENKTLGTTIKEYTKGKYSKIEDLPEFQNIKNDTCKIISLPTESYYFQKDLSFFLRSGETFNQAIYKTENNIIFRQRLFQIRKKTYGFIKNAGI